MKRPNPKNGFTVGDEEKLRREFSADLRRIAETATRDARTKLLGELGITNLNSDSTPSSRWKVAGAEDSYPRLIDQERGSLCLGNHTDDELANEVFMYGNMSAYELSSAIASGKPTSIAYLTAAKERIRWLSRHLDAALASEKKLQEELAALKARYEGDKTEIKPYVTKSEAESQAYSYSLAVENEAERIYNSWSKEEGWTPWFTGGNSTKQLIARQKAKEALKLDNNE